MKNICVYGAVKSEVDDYYIEKGYELGKMIAEKNYGLVYSGMKDGITGAVAKGVAETSNMPVIGVMPEFFKERNIEAYEGCTEKIYTNDISERKRIMKDKSDVIIITPGSLGTFDELFDAICTKKWGLMDKPIIIYNMRNFYGKLIEMLDYAAETKFGKGNYDKTFKVYDNLDDIFNYIESYNK